MYEVGKDVTREVLGEIRADTWQEAADQIDMILSEVEDHGNGIPDTFEGHPMTALSVDHLLIVQAWLLEAVNELGGPTDR